MILIVENKIKEEKLRSSPMNYFGKVDQISLNFLLKILIEKLKCKGMLLGNKEFYSCLNFA